MKNNTKQSRVCLFAVLMLFLLASCTLLAPNIIGKWVAIGDVGSLAFYKDGTFEVVDNMGAFSKGNYVLQKNGSVKFTLTHSDIMQNSVQPIDAPEVEVLDGKLSVQGDVLTFTSFDRKEILQYKRQ